MGLQKLQPKTTQRKIWEITAGISICILSAGLFALSLLGLLGIGIGLSVAGNAIFAPTKRTRAHIRNHTNQETSKNNKKRLRQEAYKTLEQKTSWRLVKTVYILFATIWTLSAFASHESADNDLNPALLRLVVFIMAYPLLKRTAIYIYNGRLDED